MHQNQGPGPRRRSDGAPSTSTAVVRTPTSSSAPRCSPTHQPLRAGHGAKGTSEPLRHAVSVAV